MISGTWWREPDWSGKDIGELVQEKIQQVARMDGREVGAARARHAAPTDAFVGTPEGHGVAAKIPKNRPQCGQPVCPENHVVAAQW